MKQHVQNMVRGALVGYTAGLARRGQSSYRPFSAYEPLPASMAASEDFDAWILWAKHLNRGLRPEAIISTRASHLHSKRPEAAFAQVNMENGLRPPMSGSFRNPLALSADAWTRSWYWGMALPPHEAALHGFWDCLCDQAADNAVIVATLCAAMRASGPLEWVRLVLGLLERVPSTRQVVREVMNGVANGEDVSTIHRRLPALAESDDVLGANLNLGYISLALLGGVGSFDKSLGVAVGCGGASHATGAYVGGMASKWHGGVPDVWSGPIGFSYVTSGLVSLERAPETIAEFSQILMDAATDDSSGCVGGEATASVEAIEDSSTGYVAEISSEQPPPLPKSAVELCPVEIPAPTSRSSVHALDGAIVTVQYEEPPVVHGDRSLQCIISFEGFAEEQLIDPKIVAPDDWQVAHRLVPFRLVRGSRHSFPLVIQPTNEGGFATLHCLGAEIRIVAFTSQPWNLCGPFPNHDGTAFEKVFKCEDILNRSEVFAARGTGGTKWQQRTFAGVSYDVEPYFQGVPGAYYFYSEFEFANPEKMRLVVSGSPGVVVKINREVVIKYNHSHVPTPRPMAPYAAPVEISGRTQLLIKLVRANAPVAPLTVYFLGEDGQLKFPDKTFPMPS